MPQGERWKLWCVLLSSSAALLGSGVAGSPPQAPCQTGCSALWHVDLRCERGSGAGVRGRVVAERAFARGERVLREEPFAYALSAAEGAHATHCHSSLVCGGDSGSGSGSKLLRCSGCKFARYLSAEEQRRAWPRHRLECGRIARAMRHGHTPSSLVLLVGRLLDGLVSPPKTNTQAAPHHQYRPPPPTLEPAPTS